MPADEGEEMPESQTCMIILFVDDGNRKSITKTADCSLLVADFAFKRIGLYHII